MNEFCKPFQLQTIFSFLHFYTYNERFCFLVIRAKVIGQKVISPNNGLHGEKMIEYKIKLIKVSCPCPSEFIDKEKAYYA